MGYVGSYWKYIVSLVALVVWVHFLGLLRFSFSVPVNTKFLGKGKLSSFSLGMLFGIVSTPCAAPILVLLLTYIATKGSSLFYGGILLLFYALGHCALILIAGTSAGAAKILIESKGAQRVSTLLRKVAGILIILVGLYFLFT